MPMMDLDNMRSNGVRCLFLYCRNCHHHASVNADRFPGAAFVPQLADRFICSRCGSKNVHSPAGMAGAKMVRTLDRHGIDAFNQVRGELALAADVGGAGRTGWTVR